MSPLYFDVVLFIGGVVAATVDTIRLDNRFGPGIAPHSWGFVTRWMVMYPKLCVTLLVTLSRTSHVQF